MNKIRQKRIEEDIKTILKKWSSVDIYGNEPVKFRDDASFLLLVFDLIELVEKYSSSSSTGLCSKRGIPLICQDVRNEPTITVENYCKWYDIYVIYPDGSIVTASWTKMREIEESSGRTLIGDHIFHPLLLSEYANIIDGSVDEVSEEVVTGRWIFEHYEKDIDEI